MRKGIKLVARILRVTTINGLPALLRKPLIMNQLSKENKINMSSVKVLILLIMSTIPTFAQTTFGYEDFKNLVLKNHPTVMISIDLFYVGLVFFRKNQPKQDFILRF